MTSHDPEIADLNWQDLITLLSELLARDRTSLQNNMAYYMRIRDIPDTDKQKLQNTYERLEHEQKRFHCLSELYFRLNETDLRYMLSGIEEVWQLQRKAHSELPEDYVLYFRKFQEQRKVYYLHID